MNVIMILEAIPERKKGVYWFEVSIPNLKGVIFSSVSTRDRKIFSEVPLRSNVECCIMIWSVKFSSLNWKAPGEKFLCHLTHTKTNRRSVLINWNEVSRGIVVKFQQRKEARHHDYQSNMYMTCPKTKNTYTFTVACVCVCVCVRNNLQSQRKIRIMTTSFLLRLS